MDLKDTVAVVTGGASGLGEACVRDICAHGGKVAIFDLNVAQGVLLAEELGENAIFCQVDVSDEVSVAAGLDATEAAFGLVSTAVNCAGVVIAAKTLGRDGAHPLASYRKVIDINLIGSFNVARLAAERMQKNGLNADGEAGVIINIGSVAAFDGQKGQAAYAASKGGIAAMTLPMSRDLASYGIRVNTVAPGLFLTPMMASLPAAAQEALGQQPLMPKRLGKPAELAHLVRFMIENPYINGEVVRLDGGVRLP